MKDFRVNASRPKLAREYIQARSQSQWNGIVMLGVKNI